MPKLTIHTRFATAAVPALVSLAIASLEARAQTEHVFGEFQVSQWDARDGLPTNVTTGIARDNDGFLWFSTMSGVSRFDGLTFENLNPGNFPALPSSITTIWNDVAGEPLLCSGGVYFRLRNAHPAVLIGAPWDTAAIPASRPDHDYMLVPSERGMFQVGANGDIHEVVGLGPPLGQSQDGTLWGMDGPDLVAYRGDAQIARHTIGNALSPKAVMTSWGEEGIIYHRRRTLVFANPEEVHIIPVDQAVADDVFGLHFPIDHLWDLRSVFPDSQGRFWLGTSSGVILCTSNPFDPSGKRASGAMRVIPASETGAVEGFYEDDSGAMWVASRHGGIFRVRPRVAYPEPRSSEWDKISRRGEWFHNSRWMTSEERQDGSKILRNIEGTVWNAIRPHDGLVSVESNEPAYWISFGGYLIRYQEGLPTRRISLAGLPKPRGMVAPIGDDLLWLHDEEIVRWRDGRASIIGSGASRFLTRRGDTLWLVANDMLTRYRNGVLEPFPQFGTQEYVYYRDVWIGPDGTLWLATRGNGLAFLRGNDQVFLRVEHGLPDNTVGGILPDDRGRLWINSNQGVFVVTADALTRFSTGSSDWVSCTLVTGVESESHRAIRGDDGRLYFDTMEGIVSLDPDRIVFSGNDPEPTLVSLHAEGREFLPAPRIALPRGTRRLTVRYTAPDPNAAEQVRFRYRFRSDHQWTDTGSQREVVFSQLGPGDHFLEIQAAGASGRWNPAGDHLHLHVPPFFRETAAFRVLVAMSIITVLSLLFYWRSLRQSRQIIAFESEVHRRRAAEASLRSMGQRLLSAQEDERRRIALEIHDDVNQRLSVLAMELDMMDSGRARPPDELSKVAKGIATDLHRLSRSLHPSKIGQLGLEKSIRSLCSEMSPGDQPRIDFEAHDVPRELKPLVSLCLFRIAQEGIRNAMRHSGADVIDVLLFGDEASMNLEIRDNGRGFDPDDSDRRGLGLSSMSERASAAGGNVTMTSSPGEGTILRATVPRYPVESPA